MSGETGEGQGKKRLLLLVNWGVGLEVLRAVEALPFCAVVQVVTQHHETTADAWHNCVWRHAADRGVPVVRQDRTGHEELRRLLRELRVDLMLVHGYRRRLPESVFSVPPHGSVNIHASLLPRHRGPAPAHWVLRDRDPATGVTSHVIDAGIDTGPIVAQESFAVAPGDTVGDLIEKTKAQVPRLVGSTLRNVFDPAFRPQRQDERRASYAPRPEERGR